VGFIGGFPQLIFPLFKHELSILYIFITYMISEDQFSGRELYATHTFALTEKRNEFTINLLEKKL